MVKRTRTYKDQWLAWAYVELSPLLEGNALEKTAPPMGLPFYDANDMLTSGSTLARESREERRDTHTVLSSRIELSSVVVSRDVKQGLVDERCDLQVRRSFNELDTGDSALRDKTGAVSLLGAPRDFLALRVSDAKKRTWRGKHV